MSDKDVKILQENQINTISDDERLWMFWHDKLQYLLNRVMKALADRGMMPKKLVRMKSYTLCPACMFAKAHKRPWRKKGKKKMMRDDQDDKTGTGASGDHVSSLHPGLIPQSTSKLTRDKFFGATIFTDHFSDFIHVTLFRRVITQETFEAKNGYEK